MEKKPFYMSKTLWINVIVFGGVFLTDLGNIMGTEGTVSLVALVNILLRVITKSAVTLK